eukprot:TRINITY_DN65718_c9_g1_i1.p1 TRINITY_DN65718_c9_g1~~TRINITY_DN65718_c9_g1_i1.p1  ORF type:complete len:1330 (+),score=121.38 TRINITY_DN65718_c9_g1_i1:44-4033(+)
MGRSPMLDWNVEQVLDFLSGKDWAGELIDSVRKHQVDGFCLASLTKDDLKTEFGIFALGTRQKILRKIYEYAMEEELESVGESLKGSDAASQSTTGVSEMPIRSTSSLSTSPSLSLSPSATHSPFASPSPVPPRAPQEQYQTRNQVHQPHGRPTSAPLSRGRGKHSTNSPPQANTSTLSHINNTHGPPNAILATHSKLPRLGSAGGPPPRPATATAMHRPSSHSPLPPNLHVPLSAGAFTPTPPPSSRYMTRPLSAMSVATTQTEDYPTPPRSLSSTPNITSDTTSRDRTTATAQLPNSSSSTEFNGMPKSASTSSSPPPFDPNPPLHHRASLEPLPRPGSSLGPRPGSSFGDRPGSSFGERPSSSFGDRPGSSLAERPGSAFGARDAAHTHSERPASSIGDRPGSSFGERPSSAFGDRPGSSLAERPGSAFGTREMNSQMTRSESYDGPPPTDPNGLLDRTGSNVSDRNQMLARTGSGPPPTEPGALLGDTGSPMSDHDREEDARNASPVVELEALRTSALGGTATATPTAAPGSPPELPEPELPIKQITRITPPRPPSSSSSRPSSATTRKDAPPATTGSVTTNTHRTYGNGKPSKNIAPATKSMPIMAGPGSNILKDISPTPPPPMLPGLPPVPGKLWSTVDANSSLSHIHSPTHPTVKNVDSAIFGTAPSYVPMSDAESSCITLDDLPTCIPTPYLLTPVKRSNPLLTSAKQNNNNNNSNMPLVVRKSPPVTYKEIMSQRRLDQRLLDNELATHCRVVDVPKPPVGPEMIAARLEEAFYADGGSPRSDSPRSARQLVDWLSTQPSAVQKWNWGPLTAEFVEATSPRSNASPRSSPGFAGAVAESTTIGPLETESRFIGFKRVFAQWNCSSEVHEEATGFIVLDQFVEMLAMLYNCGEHTAMQLAESVMDDYDDGRDGKREKIHWPEFFTFLHNLVRDTGAVECAALLRRVKDCSKVVRQREETARREPLIDSLYIKWTCMLLSGGLGVSGDDFADPGGIPEAQLVSVFKRYNDTLLSSGQEYQREHIDVGNLKRLMHTAVTAPTPEEFNAKIWSKDRFNQLLIAVLEQFDAVLFDIAIYRLGRCAEEENAVTLATDFLKPNAMQFLAQPRDFPTSVMPGIPNFSRLDLPNIDDRKSMAVLFYGNVFDPSAAIEAVAEENKAHLITCMVASRQSAMFAHEMVVQQGIQHGAWVYLVVPPRQTQQTSMYSTSYYDPLTGAQLDPPVSALHQPDDTPIGTFDPIPFLHEIANLLTQPPDIVHNAFRLWIYTEDGVTTWVPSLLRTHSIMLPVKTVHEQTQSPKKGVDNCMSPSGTGNRTLNLQTLLRL